MHNRLSTFTVPIFACLLLLAGCSSTPTQIDSGTIQARTFSFVNTAGKGLPDFAEKQKRIHELCQSAITQSMARRQVTYVERGGDVTVAYLIIAGNNVVTTSVNDYFGYGRDSAELQEKAHAKYTGSKNPNYFEAGTLVIDIVDSKTWKVLKRNYATRPLLKNPSPETQAERVNGVVEEILAGVRFKQ